jgi:hypothetical protein
MRHRHRLRIALCVVLCLLFQQLAVAAYACPLDQVPAAPEAMPERCADMDMDVPIDLDLDLASALDNPALCEAHCAPDAYTPADHATLSVPALSLPPPGFAPVLAAAAGQVAAQAEIPIARSDPPPRLRFCSLLI